MRAASIIAATLVAAGCGTVENPDLSTGAVTGRISGASAGAFAYVLGTPAVHAPIAVDGSFRLDGVPSGNRTIVLFDGTAGAGTVSTEVEGATIAVLPPAGSLPAACSILASAMLAGARPTGLAFSVDGTLLRAADGTPTSSLPGPAAVLFPIPEGYYTWTLRAGQPGYHESMEAIPNLFGGQSWPVDVSLDVETASGTRGCLSSLCSQSLACDSSDGHCYECVSGADCASGSTCDAGAHVCVPTTAPAPGSVPMCEACTADADCAKGFSWTGVCVKASGTATVGYCSYDCSSGASGSAGSCPSGYKCASLAGGSGSACQAPSGCLSLYTTYGASCATDSACSAALDGGKCLRPAGVPDSTAGVCSARCAAAADCPRWLSGWTCDATQYCRPP